MQESEVLAILPKQELQQIKIDLQFIREELSKKTESDFAGTLIESKKVPKLLNVSSRTWQTYRDSGEIPFIQLGGKIWVKRKDLEAFLDRYYVNAKGGKNGK